MKWRRPTPDFSERLALVLKQWDGTKYRAGACVPGVGVDCVRFVCAVLDEMIGRPRVGFETLPFDASLHDREGAIRGMLAIRQHFRPNELVKDGSLEPGDVVIVGPDGAPGHAMLVGCAPGHFWHASNLAGKVCRSGEDYFRVQKIHAVVRYGDRKGWVRG